MNGYHQLFQLLTTVFLLVLVGGYFHPCSAFTTAQTSPDGQSSLSATKLNLFLKSPAPPPPPPPWSFQGSRIYYKVLAIPTDIAKRYCPSSKLTLLSWNGYTLGGIFCVEYTDSPVGPYREVAFLSGLMCRFPSCSIGAWASHIYVNSEEAAQYGKQFWGLPAETIPIEKADQDDDTKSLLLDIFLNDKGILWKGWNKFMTNEYITSTSMDWFSLSLPSFSGNLRTANGVSPLLQYPLCISRPQRLSINSYKRAFDTFILFEESKRSPIQSQTLKEAQEMVEKSLPLLSISIDYAELEAGIPKEI